MRTIMIKYPIGIDMSANHLAAAQLQRQRNGHAIRALSYHELDDGEVDADQADDAVVIALLKDIAKSRQFAGRNVALNIPTKNLFIFPLQIQVGKQETLEEAILRQSEEYLPFPIEEAVIDYPCLTRESGGDPDRYRVTIVAARQSIIGNYLSLLNEAGFVVGAIDFAVSSLLRLHQSLYTMMENPILLCHVGPTKSLLAAATRDSIIIQSDVTWGSHRLINGIISDLDLSHDRKSARFLLEKYGVGFESAPTAPVGQGSPTDGETADIGKTIFRIVSPYLDEIIYELHKIISYVRSEKQNPVFDGLFLYGQASYIHYFDRYLEKRMDTPTTVVDPLAVMTNDRNQIPLEESAAGTFALALGLAMRRLPWL